MEFTVFSAQDPEPQGEHGAAGSVTPAAAGSAAPAAAASTAAGAAIGLGIALTVGTGLVLSALAQANAGANSSSSGTDTLLNGIQNGSLPGIPVVPEANAGMVLIPVVAAMLFFFTRRLWLAKTAVDTEGQKGSR